MQILPRLMQVLIMSWQLGSRPARQGTGCRRCRLRKRHGFALVVCPLCLSPPIPSLLPPPRCAVCCAGQGQPCSPSTMAGGEAETKQGGEH